jgi:hypothetical protein
VTDQPDQVRFARRFIAKTPGQPDIHGIQFPDSGHVIADIPHRGLTAFMTVEGVIEGVDGAVIQGAVIHWAEEAEEQPAHDDGPSIAEAAADDRRWPLEKAGE